MLTVSFGGPTSSPTRASPSTRSSASSRPGEGDDPAVDLALDALADPANLVPLHHRVLDDPDRPRRQRRRQDAPARGDLRRRRERRHYDLEADLRGLMETDGDDTGRFSDTDSRLRQLRQRHRPGPRPSSPSTAPPAARPTAAVDYLLGPAVLRRQLPAVPVRLHAGLRPVRGRSTPTPATTRPRATRRDGVRAHGAPARCRRRPRWPARSTAPSTTCSASSSRPAASSAPAR